jgi:hypothetical protein
MTDVIHNFINQNPSHPLVKSLHSIATDNSCRDTTQSQIDNLTLSMRAIVNHHLQDMADEKKADCTAEIFFNSSMFNDASLDKVAHKVAQGVNSNVFSPVALSNTIDCHVAVRSMTQGPRNTPESEVQRGGNHC